MIRNMLPQFVLNMIDHIPPSGRQIRKLIAQVEPAVTATTENGRPGFRVDLVDPLAHVAVLEMAQIDLSKIAPEQRESFTEGVRHGAAMVLTMVKTVRRSEYHTAIAKLNLEQRKRDEAADRMAAANLAHEQAQEAAERAHEVQPVRDVSPSRVSDRESGFRMPLPGTSLQTQAPQPA